jgi:hypothetical protein
MEVVMKKSLVTVLAVFLLCLGMIMTDGSYRQAQAMSAVPYYDFYINGTLIGNTGNSPNSGNSGPIMNYDSYTGILHVYGPITPPNNIPITIPSFSFFLKFDPYLNYSLNFQNDTGSNQTIGSIVLTGGIYLPTSDNIVSAFVKGNVLGASQASFLGTFDFSTFPGTWTWTNAGVDVSLGGTAGPQAGPHGIWNGVQIRLTDLVIPVDASSLQGEFRVNPVPIPGALWLLASGLAGIIGARKRLTKKHSA